MHERPINAGDLQASLSRLPQVSTKMAQYRSTLPTLDKMTQRKFVTYLISRFIANASTSAAL
jgi:hypothetical protein